MSLDASQELLSTPIISSIISHKPQEVHQIVELDSKTSLKATEDLLMHSSTHQKSIPDHKIISALEMKSNLPEASEKLINVENETRKTETTANGSMENNNNATQMHTATNFPQTAYFQHPSFAFFHQNPAFHPLAFQPPVPELLDPTLRARAMEEFYRQSRLPVPSPTPETKPNAFPITNPEELQIRQPYISQMQEEKLLKWGEVRKFSEYIRRFSIEAAHVELTKESYYDLYNMAVCLLKAVDSLDPEKANTVPQQRKQSEFDISSQTPTPGLGPHSEMERKSFDYLYRRNSALDPFHMYYTSNQPVFIYPPSAPPKAEPPLKQQKISETYFDDLQQSQQPQSQSPPEEKKAPKRQRRRRTAYSQRRNLHCHMCGVTETPEWRRGPAGDHTLCNACGLHYAKSLKKQRKEREGRKHSIEMLLNQPQNNNSAAAPPPPNTTTTTTSTETPQ